MDIKFRIWDYEMQKMYYSTDDGVLITFDRIGLSIYLINEMRELSNFEIMQYTGRKDSQGIEIYDGDILDILVESYDFAEEFTRNANTKFYVEFDNEVSSFTIKSKTVNHLYHGFDEVADENMKVIGNIYENPKLLEE